MPELWKFCLFRKTKFSICMKSSCNIGSEFETLWCLRSKKSMQQTQNLPWKKGMRYTSRCPPYTHFMLDYATKGCNLLLRSWLHRGKQIKSEIRSDREGGSDEESPRQWLNSRSVHSWVYWNLHIKCQVGQYQSFIWAPLLIKPCESNFMGNKRESVYSRPFLTLHWALH